MTSGTPPTDTEEMKNYLRFIQGAISVLLALLVVDVAGSLTQAVDAGRFAAETVLLLVLLFLLLELFVVVSDLHVKLQLPYAQPWLYMDLLIGVVFYWFATAINDSGTCRMVEGADCAGDLRPAMRIGIVLFAAFLVRLLVGYRLVGLVRALDTQTRRTLLLRSAANVGGIVLSILISVAEPDGFLGLSVLGWSLVGAVVMAAYFVLRAVPYRLELTFARRAR